MTNISDHLMVVLFLFMLTALILGICFMIFYPVVREQKRHQIKMNQIEADIKKWKDHKPKPEVNDEPFREALDKELNRQIRRNRKTKRKR